MSPRKQIEQLINQMEHYVECWKQFNHYIMVARSKEFTPDEEAQFLDVKSVIAQDYEVILATIDGGVPSKEEVHSLLTEAPSIRCLSELNEGGIKAIESKWHKLYISWQSMLGQLKVKQQQMEAESGWSLFRRKKS